MKTDGTYIYYPWNNKLERYCIKTGESITVKETAEDGFFRLGDISGGYLYYAEIGNTTTIGRILLKDLSGETISVEKSDNSYGFGSLHIDSEGTVYSEEKMGFVSKCHMYQYNKDTNIWTSKENKAFVKEAEEIEKQLKADLRSDYIQVITGENIAFFTSSGGDGLFIYDINKKQVKNIKGYDSNLMLMDKEKGFVYTDKDYNIHLCSYVKPYNDRIIFKPDKETPYINYGIYDKNGIYGYCQNKENKYVLARISWNGEINKLYTFSSGKDVLLIGVSAFGDSISFIDDGEFKLVKF